VKVLRAIGIVRVSQIEDGAQSPETQALRIAEHCERNSWQLIEILNENDAGNGRVRNVSGGADLADRPGLGPAVERVERGEVEVIVAAYFDRFFRSLQVQGEVVGRVEAAGGRVESVDMGEISNATATGELTATMHGAIGQYFRRQAKEKSVAAVTQAIAQGKVPWSQTAPGYRRTAESTLVPDPKLAPVMVEAFKMRSKGATVQSIRDYLAAHGIARSYHGVLSLLASRVYLGEIHFKDRANLEAHKPIIDRDVFERVQKVSSPRGRRAKSENLLARLGVLRCGSCGARMVVGSSKNSGYRIYRCPPTGDCDRRVTIAAPMIESLVVEQVKELLTGIQGTAQDDGGVTEAALERDRTEQRLTAAIEAFADLVAEPSVKQKLNALRDARDAANARYEDLSARSNATSIAVDVGDWDRLTLDEQRALIRATVETVTVAPGRVDRVRVQFV
jgi:site-specific DNA recombinase